jgi:hypothetical protein
LCRNWRRRKKEQQRNQRPSNPHGFIVSS